MATSERRSLRANAGVNTKFMSPSEPAKKQRQKTRNYSLDSKTPSVIKTPAANNNTIGHQKTPNLLLHMQKTPATPSMLIIINEKLTSLENKLESQKHVTDSLAEKIKELENENATLKNELAIHKSLTFATGLLTPPTLEYTIPTSNKYSALVDNNTDFIISTSPATKPKTNNTSQSYNKQHKEHQQQKESNLEKKTYKTALTSTEKATKTHKTVLTSTESSINIATNILDYSSTPTQALIIKNLKVKENKKVMIIGDSHVKRLNKDIINFNTEKDNVKTYSKSYDGAKSMELNHHILTTLYQDEPDMTIIHVGTNDINTRTINSVPPIDVANNIITIGKRCKSFGIKCIVFSSILPRKDKKFQKYINEVNEHVKNICDFNSFLYIDNSNINEDYLHSDDIHLNTVGSYILGENIIKSIDSHF